MTKLYCTGTHDYDENDVDYEPKEIGENGKMRKASAMFNNLRSMIF
jgi:hypothetical protein